MFPSFQDGRVTFATGFSLEEKFRLNYNLYSGQMDSNPKRRRYHGNGPIKESDACQYRKINLFYHDNNVGYIEIVHQSPVALGILKRLSTWATTLASDIYCTKEEHYYFLDQENKSYLASATSIQKLFDDQRKKIKAYLAENKIDFTNQSDLIKILKFCDELSNEHQK